MALRCLIDAYTCITHTHTHTLPDTHTHTLAHSLTHACTREHTHTHTHTHSECTELRRLSGVCMCFSQLSDALRQMVGSL